MQTEPRNIVLIIENDAEPWEVDELIETISGFGIVAVYQDNT
jgi:hypothetical protein